MNRNALLSFCMGILSIGAFLFIPYIQVSLLSLAAGAVGIVEGIKAKKETQKLTYKEHILMRIGIFSSTVGVLIAAIIIIAVFLLLIDFMPFIELLPYKDGHYRFFGIDW